VIELHSKDIIAEVIDYQENFKNNENYKEILRKCKITIDLKRETP
jgi:hypothetical protein